MPTTTQDFSPRLAGEKPILAVDFSANLASGETITAASCQCAVSSGTDSLSSQNRVSGAATIKGSVIAQLFDFASGTIGNGTRFMLTFSAATSLGQTILGVSHVAVNQPS